MKATYTGSGNPTTVEWSYSGDTDNLIITTSNCQLFGAVPPNFPSADRITFFCPASHTFRLEVTKLQSSELSSTWGATFTPPVGTIPAPNEKNLTECESSTSTSRTSTPTTSTIPAANTSSTSFPPNVTDGDGKKIVVGVSVGVVIAVVLAILNGVCCYCKYKNKQTKTERPENKVSYSNDYEQNIPENHSSTTVAKNRL